MKRWMLRLAHNICVVETILWIFVNVFEVHHIINCNFFLFVLDISRKTSVILIYWKIMNDKGT